MASYLVDDALADVKVRANIPTSNGALTDAELLVQGNDELRGILTGRLMEPLQGYLLTELTQATGAGTSLYDIPSRAAGGKVAYLAMQDATGARRPLVNKAVGELAAASRASSTNSQPVCFYFQGMQIGLYPAPSNTSESLIIGYYMRPNRMVLAASCAPISTVNSTTNITPLSGISNFSVGQACDFVQVSPHFRAYSTDNVIASKPGGVNISFTTAVTGLAVGDYVCAAGDSCVLQLPVEVQTLLIARWALRVMKARAPSSPDAKSLAQDVADLESSLFDYLSNRNETQLETVGASGLNSRYGRLGWGLVF